MDLLEEWRDIPGMPGYKASRHGRVGRMFYRRGVKNRPGVMFVKWFSEPKPMFLAYNPHTRYWAVAILGRSYYVHRLVAMAFHGLPSEKLEVAHIDGDRSNNRPENLRWSTHQENEADKTIHGTRVRGSMHPLAKLNEDMVSKMRARLRDGMRVHVVAKEFGVKYHRVYKIAHNMAWKHVV